MNKVVPTILAMSAALVFTGCASSGGARHSSYAGMNAGHGYAAASCATCGPGSHAVAHSHGHNNHMTGRTVTHSHAGGAGHVHNGMSGSHSYVSANRAYAGRNTYVNGVAVGGGSGGGISTVAKVAGSLLVGGLIYNAIEDDDDDDSKGSGSGDHKK